MEAFSYGHAIVHLYSKIQLSTILGKKMKEKDEEVEEEEEEALIRIIQPN